MKKLALNSRRICARLCRQRVVDYISVLAVPGLAFQATQPFINLDWAEVLLSDFLQSHRVLQVNRKNHTPILYISQNRCYVKEINPAMDNSLHNDSLCMWQQQKAGIINGRNREGQS